jgi:hypothetical protein
LRSSNRDLWLAFTAVVVISLLYLFVVIYFGSIPAAGEFFGHSLGIVGFILMLMAETLYSMRKRSRSARMGPMAGWLQFHVFTGIVGPYLVLLHSSWKFNGLAGMVMLFTGIIVASGFVGRFIYTAVPRTSEGMVLGVGDIRQQLSETEVEIQQWGTVYPHLVTAMYGQIGRSDGEFVQSWRQIFFGGFLEFQFHRRMKNEINGMNAKARAQGRQIESLVRREHRLRRQLANLVLTRKLLSAWYIFHVPVGIVLFIAAVLHIIGAVYFATLLR